MAQSPTPVADGPEEAGYRNVGTNGVKHRKAKGIIKEVRRQARAQGGIEHERTKLGPKAWRGFG